MREIKFRAWFVGWKKAPGCVEEPARMVYDIQNGGGLGWQDGFVDYLDEEDYIVEQYTGLKDKNGKKIYEGDIVKQLMYVLEGKKCITTWVVKWNNDEFCYELHRVSGALYGDSMLSTCESKDCEVIGNIHENPELLKK